MPLFFGNPILGRLEDLLWAKAKQRYIDEGGNPFTDLAELPKDAKAQLSSWVATWKSAERKKLDLAWPEYKRTVEDSVAKALQSVLKASEASWYSIEAKDFIYPVVFVVPLQILRHKTREALPDLLKQPILFQNLTPEALAAFSDLAIEDHFNAVVRSFIKRRTDVEIDRVFRPAIIVDVVRDDPYHFGASDEVLREEMVIFHSFEGSVPKDIKKAKKNAHKDWKARRKHPDGRPQDRRFSGDAWSVPASVLSTLGRR